MSGSIAKRWQSLAGKGLALIAAVAPAVALGQTKPVLVDPVFTEDPLPTFKIAADATPCKVHVIAITDTRRTPEMVGMLGGKPVVAPDDRAAWLGSIIAKLADRGITLDTGNPGNLVPDQVNARFTLITAWTTAVNINLNHSVVFKLEAGAPDGRTVDDFFRGSSSRMNWAFGNGEIKFGLSMAFSRALDSMAAGLATLCTAKK